MNNENEQGERVKCDVSLLTIQTVAETIRDVVIIPSNKLYAQLAETLEPSQYQQAISALKRVGLVTETSDKQLKWNGSEIRQSAKPTKIELSRIPEHTLDTVRILAAAAGVTISTPEDYERFIRENEDALEVVLPYIDFDYTDSGAK